MGMQLGWTVVNGPASPPGYSRVTGIQTNIPGLRNINAVVASPGSSTTATGYFPSVDGPVNYATGNQVTLHIYSGSSEVAAGTDLSQYTFRILAVSQ